MTSRTRDTAHRYRNDTDADARLLRKIQRAGAGAWGDIPMPPQSGINEQDLRAIIRWILGGART